ncbi:ATP F0F1 synthase subunit alpha [Bacillus sp. L_1B0_8]|uniref:ATP F0F1 synthase subunit alpha n=1 Tax=unclassified Bacillus (in: firmicutes) TaxID=185979 RepID=UPI0005B69DBA|nr:MULTISPECIES: ATP F0F1 synthase subunit alpha [unclassified Bacillus (in: firmicutes)]KIQ80052.1 ATP F0F1 synthase subunit alpha [Bacillus sp. L_1B0_5]KIQ86066.1 ATP F0F1 synthase subunit alpha [Bacillus sp. L_1B0_8]
MKKVILAGALGIAALAGTNLPGLEATKASAAVESSVSTIEGRIVEVIGNTIYVEVKKSTEFIDYKNHFSISMDNLNPNLKIGDDIVAVGAMMHSFAEYMIAQSVEKVQNTDDSLHEGKYIKGAFAYEYEIGYITKIDKHLSRDYVNVQYTDKDGIKKREVTVYLTKGQKFNLGDKVKVHMENVMRDMIFSVEDEIEKVNDSQTQILNADQWIWS